MALVHAPVFAVAVTVAVVLVGVMLAVARFDLLAGVVGFGLLFE